MRLSQVARKLNVGTASIVTFLVSKGFNIENKPNTKISPEQFDILSKEFVSSIIDKEESAEVAIGIYQAQTDSPNLAPSADEVTAEPIKKIQRPRLEGVKTIGKVDLEQKNINKVPEKVVDTVAPPELSKIKPNIEILEGVKVLGKIELPDKKEGKPKYSRQQGVNRVNLNDNTKKPESKFPKQAKPKPLRNRFRSNTAENSYNKVREEISNKDIDKEIKKTLERIKNSSSDTKNRREKKTYSFKQQLEVNETKVINTTEFISANTLASLLDVSVNQILSTCIDLGIIISINQSLDAETITLIADEFGYSVNFTVLKEEVEDSEVNEANLVPRAPIVTIMGHVDHGKTSLLDYIRNSNAASYEAGGITQHIGAYQVVTKDKKQITFLDTPGHEAFTAMRARGAKVTDVAVIVIAADDNVMPQTKEAINHVQLAGVPIVIAINKIDSAGANPEKIKEQLAAMNILVEDWGGKYQCQLVSAKTGEGIDELLDKVLLEADILDLKADPVKKGVGTILEASLDQGRGYVATILIQGGTLNIGETILANVHYGKIRAMYDYKGKKLTSAGPSVPVQVFGLNGAPQAGTLVKVIESDKIARDIANQKQQILREQDMRTKKLLTLDEIGRRLAVGNFKEFNLIIKGDTDGSIQAISDSLLKLSTEGIKVNIIYKAVGTISESDVLLASASGAVIIAFQVRPLSNVRKLAEKEGVEIKSYSIIYDAINDVKDAIKGLSETDELKEEVTGAAEVRALFKVTKVGMVAGCYVTDGYIKRQNKVRLVRDGVVIYTGSIKQIKRGKDDAQQVKANFECGISIENFNDIKVGDVIEGFEENMVTKS
jgi:translation initiation factor IF-2